MVAPHVKRRREARAAGILAAEKEAAAAAEKEAAAAAEKEAAVAAEKEVAAKKTDAAGTARKPRARKAPAKKSS